jgi:hypothetical protein
MDFQTEADCAPNLNSATIAGKVIDMKPLTGKTVGFSFVVGYQKHWPNGIQEIPLKCYVSGAERIEKLGWLKVGEVVLVRGELTDKGSLYGLQIDQLSVPERIPGENDAYLSGMQKYGQRR